MSADKEHNNVTFEATSSFAKQKGKSTWWRKTPPIYNQTDAPQTTTHPIDRVGSETRKLIKKKKTSKKKGDSQSSRKSKKTKKNFLKKFGKKKKGGKGEEKGEAAGDSAAPPGEENGEPDADLEGDNSPAPDDKNDTGEGKRKGKKRREKKSRSRSKSKSQSRQPSAGKSDTASIPPSEKSAGGKSSIGRKSRFNIFSSKKKGDGKDDEKGDGKSYGGAVVSESGEEESGASDGGRAGKPTADGMRFTYDFSAVTADHGITDTELKQNIKTKIEQIQTCRTEVKFIKEKLKDLQTAKETKQKNLLGLDDRQRELESQLAREIDLRIASEKELEKTELQLGQVMKKKSTLDTKDKYTFQLQQKVHEELSTSMKGYTDAYSTVMCDKMATLEVWHSVSQTYLEKTACMTESHQKAKQAFSAASVKYKRLKTSRDQLSSELRNLQEETARETATIVQNTKEQTTRELEKLQRYKDQLQRCLVNRDLKYESVLEAKDVLVARIKEQMDSLHQGYQRMDDDGQACLKLFADMVEQRKVNPFSDSTTRLLDVLPLETEYLTHLEKIAKVLSEYVACMREIDTKREDLLQQRATLMDASVHKHPKTHEEELLVKAGHHKDRRL